MNTDPLSSNNQNSPRSDNYVSHTLQDSTPFERRHLSIMRDGANLVKLLFSYDYENIGVGILKYLSSRDIRSLRTVCTNVCSMLSQKALESITTPDDALFETFIGVGQIDYKRKYPYGSREAKKLIIATPYTIMEEHKIDDLFRLELILKILDKIDEIDAFSEESRKLLTRIGFLALDLNYNDEGEYNREYIRNKYGSVDRSETGKKRIREKGLELIHLAALEKIANKADHGVVAAAISELKKDLAIIKTKINLIINAERTLPLVPSKEVLDKYKDIGSTMNFTAFVNYFYAIEIVNELVRILEDSELQHLDFIKRGDRYYFGRILSLVGELSRDLRDFLNQGKESGLFSFFKKIRDNKMAHSYLTMVLDIDEKQNNSMILLRTLLTVNFRKALHSIKDYLEGLMLTEVKESPDYQKVWNNIKKMKVNLSKTTEAQKIALNNLLKVIFDKSDAQIDDELLLNMDSIEAKYSSEEKQDLTEKEVVKQKAIVVRNAITSMENIIRKVKKINELKAMKKKQRQIADISKETYALIEGYNKALNDYDKLKISDSGLPTLEELEIIQKDLVNSEAAITVIEKQAKEKELIEENKKNEEKTENKTRETKSEEEARLKKQIAYRLSVISKEISYVMNVINDEKIDECKKNYIIEFSFSKIGQIFKDIGKKEKKERELLIESVPEGFNESMKVTERTRHKLMHDILNRRKILDFAKTLFRHTLPMLSEIKSLKEVLKYQTLEEAILSSDDVDSLFKLGRAYVVLKNYNKAMECFESMQKICESKMVLINDNTILENDINILAGILNAQFGLAELYGKAGNDELSKGNKIQAQEFYRYKIIYLEQYIKLALEYPNIIQSQIASAYNNLANTYSDVNDFDKAVQSHKKAFELLKELKNKDSKREALYLSNLGITYMFEHQRRIHLALGEQEDIHEAIKTMQLAVACLWEAREGYERAGIAAENSEYVRVTSQLIEALYYCSSNRKNALYAQELFHKLKIIVQRFPARENSQEILMMNKLEEEMQLASQLNYPRELVERFENDREIVDLEFELERLNYLRVFYADIGIQCELNDRLAILRKRLAKCVPSELSLEARFHLEIGTLVNKSSELLRQNLPAKALEGYLIALQGLSSVEYKKFIPDVIGDLLESIGDTYSALRELTKALEYFMRSLETHDEHGPNDRAFGIPGKIISLNKEFFEACLKALVILKKVYGNEHPNVAKSYANVGEVLRNQGNYAEALKFHRLALAINEQVHGKDHPNVAISYNYIGLSLNFQGKYSDALEYLRQALVIFEKVLGPKHPNTLTCMQNIKFVEEQIPTQKKAELEVTWVHPDIDIFINTAFTNTAQDLLKMAGIDINEVKMTVDTSRIGKMRLSLNFSNSTTFKKFVKYYREKYSNLFLHHTQWEYNPGQPVEILLDTKVLQNIMPELERFRTSIPQEKK